MSNKRKFKDLTIRDNFMFAAVMMEDDNCKRFLEMLLGISIKEIVINREKSLIYNPEYKGVRLDVYANDENNTRYDIEMQVAEQKLGKRIRYYHSQMDMELLESGQKYKELPASYVIFICDFDPFKKRKYCYTFENRCAEEPELRLDDDSISIILSTEGVDTESIPKELKDFLEFVKEDNPENNSKSEDEYVHQLQRTIQRMKENRKAERGFMAWIDIRDEIRDEIREEVRDEVRNEVRDEVRNESIVESKKESVLDLLSEFGEVPEELKHIVMSENRVDALKSMLKIAAKATAFSDFREQISKL